MERRLTRNRADIKKVHIGAVHPDYASFKGLPRRGHTHDVVSVWVDGPGALLHPLGEAVDVLVQGGVPRHGGGQHEARGVRLLPVSQRQDVRPVKVPAMGQKKLLLVQRKCLTEESK